MQFADRRLFLFLFNYQYTAAMATEVFASLGASLPPPSPQGEGEGEGPEEDAKEITVVSPVTYFLQDAINSHNFPQEVRLPSLVHLALYVEKTPLSLTSMFKTMNLVDTFCRKLKSTPVRHYLSVYTCTLYKPVNPDSCSSVTSSTLVVVWIVSGVYCVTVLSH
jgi:hypothetical protein